jgi:hypothetical protein
VVKKKNDENGNNDETNVDTSGKRKRKRFSKIE